VIRGLRRASQIDMNGGPYHDGVRLERAGRAAFVLGVTAAELSSLIAAVRIAADVLEADERTPPEAVARLRALLGDYERAAARLDRPDERPGDQSGGSLGPAPA
jgi:hypothetical protein